MARWDNALQTREEIQRVKRMAVLQEAARAFSERGYHNTSLDDVAKALKVSKGTLYNYVKDKREILFECQMMAADIGDEAFARGQEEGRTGSEKLRITLKTYIERTVEELGSCSVIMEIDALRPADRKKIVARRDGFQKAFVDMIEEGMADGTLQEMDPKIAVYTFMGAINWIPRWYRADGRMEGPALAEEITRLLLDGLAVRRAGRSSVRSRAAE